VSQELQNQAREKEIQVNIAKAECEKNPTKEYNSAQD
jgi:hypothetical protein